MLANATTNVLIGIGVLIVLAIVGGVVALRLRRAMFSSELALKEGLLLSDLRSMHARGELSDEEFESLREAALREYGVSEAKKSPPAGQGPGVDLAGDPLPEANPSREHPEDGEKPENGGE